VEERFRRRLPATGRGVNAPNEGAAPDPAAPANPAPMPGAFARPIDPRPRPGSAAAAAAGVRATRPYGWNAPADARGERIPDRPSAWTREAAGPSPLRAPISRVPPSAVRPLPAAQLRDEGPARAGEPMPVRPPATPSRDGLRGGTGATAGRGLRAPLPGPGGLPRGGFGLPNLRRNICPHFYMTGARGAIPIQAPHLLKALVRQEANVSRCQLRGGVHLEQGYVNDVCLSARFNQCVFYEDDLGS
jgi:hypothetical protein